MDAATHTYIQYIQYRSNDPNVQSNYSTVYSIVCTARSCAHVLMVRALVRGVLLRSSVCLWCIHVGRVERFIRTSYLPTAYIVRTCTVLQS